MRPTTRGSRPPSNASVARGMVVAVAILGMMIALRAALDSVPETMPRRPPPDCARPVEVEAEGTLRVACAGDDLLAPCGHLVEGDRVRLEGGSCRRVPAGMSAGSRLVYGLKIDINRASADDLQLLEGIGPQLARAVVDYRNTNGPFTSLDELHRIRGMGAAKVAMLRAYLEVGEQP